MAEGSPASRVAGGETSEYDGHRESGEAPKSTQPPLVCGLETTPVLYLTVDRLGEEVDRGSPPTRYESLPWADSNSKTMKDTIVRSRWKILEALAFGRCDAFSKTILEDRQIVRAHV